MSKLIDPETPEFQEFCRGLTTSSVVAVCPEVARDVVGHHVYLADGRVFFRGRRGGEAWEGWARFVGGTKAAMLWGGFAAKPSAPASSGIPFVPPSGVGGERT